MGLSEPTEERFIAESVSEKKLKSVNIWQSYRQERGCFVQVVRLALLQVEQSARDNLRFCPKLCQIFTDLKKIQCRLSNKPLLIWLLKFPLCRKHVTTVPCNFLLMTALVCDYR